MSPNILSLKEVCVNVNKISLLKSISLNVKEGGVLGLIGTSGSGKTTLLKTICGLMPIDSGEIFFKEEPISSDILTKVGFCSQENSFYEELSLIDNALYFGRLMGVSTSEVYQKFDNLASLLEIADKKFVLAQNLSGGMKKRFELLLSLIHSPKILILDEPTTGLDSFLRKKMWYLIKLINNLGITIIITSHYLDEIDYLCDNLCVLVDGQIKISSDVDHIKNHFLNKFKVEVVLDKKNYVEFLNEAEAKKIDVINRRIDQDTLIFYTTRKNIFLNSLKEISTATDSKIITIKIQRPELDEVLQAIKFGK